MRLIDVDTMLKWAKKNSWVNVVGGPKMLYLSEVNRYLKKAPEVAPFYDKAFSDGIAAERERFMKVLESKLSELKKDTLAHEYNSDMMFGYESGLRFALEALDKEVK